jgi:hypothetical protein
MLFSDWNSEEESLQSSNAARQKLLEKIVADFQIAFPDLKFELRLKCRVINAQAISLGDQRCVLIYGGLALHPKLGEDSLTFILLHEAGHHLAVGSRLMLYTPLYCECASDYWATTVGADSLRRRSGRHFRMECAVRELNELMAGRQNLWYDQSDVRSYCWNYHWSMRKRALLTAKRPPDNPTCCK